jgi:siroheme synthase-like protein
MLPLFLNLTGRRLLVVGGGPVAAAKLSQLVAAGAAPADIEVVAPHVVAAIEQSGARIARRPFAPADVDGAWLVVAAAPGPVNRAVAAAAEGRQIFVNAVDDPANASAYLGGVVRRSGVTIAISTDGAAPALAGLLREGLDALLPMDLDTWMAEAGRQREAWRAGGVPMEERRGLLLEALNRLHDEKREAAWALKS